MKKLEGEKKDWKMAIAEDLFDVKAVTYQSARLEAARAFKMKYHIPASIPITKIAYDAFRVVSFKPKVATSDYLKYLYREVISVRSQQM